MVIKPENLDSITVAKNSSPIQAKKVAVPIKPKCEDYGWRPRGEPRAGP